MMDTTDTANSVAERIANLEERRFTRIDAESFLAELGRSLGIGPLEMTEDGAVDLVIDRDIPLGLVFSETLQGFIVLSPLEVALDDRPDLLAQLLRSNMDPAVVAGGCFAMVPPMAEPAYCALLLPGAEDLDAFEHGLSVFLERASSFRDEIDAALLDDQDSTVPPPGAPQVWA